MKIRKTVESDKERLLGIWLRSVRASHTFLTEDDIRSILPQVRDLALEELELWTLTKEMGEAHRVVDRLHTGNESVFVSYGRMINALNRATAFTRAIVKSHL